MVRKLGHAISKRKWNESFELNGVKFDGVKDGVLVDAKSGMHNFVNGNSKTFKPFFTGKEDVFKQARRQRTAAGDLPINWHFNHTFYTVGIRSNGSPFYGDLDINMNRVYFTMPTWMSNGSAANLTAALISAAIEVTDLYFFENPDIIKFALADFFKRELTRSLKSAGGSFSTTVAPFAIRSPAPYKTSVVGISNLFNCE